MDEKQEVPAYPSDSAPMRPLKLSPELEAIVGKGPMPRATVTRNLWQYIKENNLCDVNNRRLINADEKLRTIFGGKRTINMFEMTKFTSAHMVDVSGIIELNPISWQLRWNGQVARITFSVSNAGSLSKTETNELTTVNAYLKNELHNLYPQVKDLESLISSKRTSEKDLQVFFEQHPEFLLGIEYRRLYPQVILEPDNGNLIPDFFLEPVTTEFCDIVELKKPIDSLVVGKKNRRRFAAAVYEGVAQLREYSGFFEDRDNRVRTLNKFGIKAYRPKMTLIIGRNQDDEDQFMLRRIRDEMSVTVMTYDELLSISKNLLLRR